jgi:hypothetical protein
VQTLDSYGIGEDGANRQASSARFDCYAVSSDGIHWEKPDLGALRDRRVLLRQPVLLRAHADYHCDLGPAAHYIAGEYLRKNA